MNSVFGMLQELGFFISPLGLNHLDVNEFINGTLCIERGLGNNLTGSVHFVFNVLVMVMAMGSTIYCNGARP